LRDGEFCGEANETFVAELAEPLAVAANFGLGSVENFENLGLISFGVLVDLLAAEGGTGGDASGGIADEAGEIAERRYKSYLRIADSL